jgi:hypothetical protein
MVSTDGIAGYRVNLHNAGPSSIAALYLTTDISDKPVYILPSQGSCQDKSLGKLNCELGAVKKNGDAWVTVAYDTSGASDTFSVIFLFSTTGNTASDGGTSHGDSKPLPASTQISTDSSYAGGFVIDPNDPITTTSDQQTTVHPPKSGIVVTVAEGGSGNPCATAHTIGQNVTLHITESDGTQTISQTPFLTSLTIPTSGLPAELELSQVKLCHQYDNGTATPLPRCASDAAPTNGIACFWPKFTGAHATHDNEVHGVADADDWTSLVLDMWDFQNGSIRGGF